MKQAPSLQRFLADLGRQTTGLLRRAAGHLAVFRGRSGAASPRHAGVGRGAPTGAEGEKAGRVAGGESDGGAAATGPTGGSDPEPGEAGPRQISLASPAWAGEAAGNGARPEAGGGGGGYKDRFDAARRAAQEQGQNAEEMQALLEQAITLLERVSQHPALADYSAQRRRLEEIEQRLGSGAYPQ